MDTSVREVSTSATLEEKKKLRKEFKIFDMIFITVAGIIGLDTIGAVSSNGGTSPHLAINFGSNLLLTLWLARIGTRNDFSPGRRCLRVVQDGRWTLFCSIGFDALLDI